MLSFNHSNLVSSCVRTAKTRTGIGSLCNTNKVLLIKVTMMRNCVKSKHINKLNPSSNRSLFKLNISDAEINFRLNMCILIGKSLAVFLDQLFFLQSLGLKMKKKIDFS